MKSPLGTITAPFGEVTKIHIRPHTGVDIAMPIGTEVASPVDGIVAKTIQESSGSSLGNAVIIKTEQGYRLTFGHLDKIKVHVGELVHGGEIVGLSGSTGHSTGGHLHFAVQDLNGKYIDPLTLVIEKAKAMMGFIDDWIHVLKI